MQAIAYGGYLENGRFYPLRQPIRKQGKVRAILTVLDEPIKVQTEDIYAAWHNQLKEAIAASMDEELPDIVRSKEVRPTINFAD